MERKKGVLDYTRPMRTPLYLAAALLLRVCGGLGSDALVAHHGGVVVPFDAHAVEVVARSDGDVEAWVVDGDAVIVPSQTLVVVVQGPEAPQEVSLVWDPGTSSYKGRAPAPVVEGALDVRLVIEGAPVTARVERIVVAAPAPSTTIVVGAPPSVTVTPTVGARVETRVETGRPSVVVVPPSPPSIVVAPPRPSVVIVPPSPPSVVIRPPSPPGVVVVGPRPGVVVVDGDRDDRHDEDRDHRHDEDRDDHHDEGHRRGRGHDRHGHGSVTVTPGVLGPSVTVGGGGHGRRGGRGRH